MCYFFFINRYINANLKLKLYIKLQSLNEILLLRLDTHVMMLIKLRAVWKRKCWTCLFSIINTISYHTVSISIYLITYWQYPNSHVNTLRVFDVRWAWTWTPWTSTTTRPSTWPVTRVTWTPPHCSFKPVSTQRVTNLASLFILVTSLYIVSIIIHIHNIACHQGHLRIKASRTSMC